MAHSPWLMAHGSWLMEKKQRRKLTAETKKYGGKKVKRITFGLLLAVISFFLICHSAWASISAHAAAAAASNAYYEAKRAATAERHAATAAYYEAKHAAISERHAATQAYYTAKQEATSATHAATSTYYSTSSSSSSEAVLAAAKAALIKAQEEAEKKKEEAAAALLKAQQEEERKKEEAKAILLAAQQEEERKKAEAEAALLKAQESNYANFIDTQEALQGLQEQTGVNLSVDDVIAQLRYPKELSSDLTKFLEREDLSRLDIEHLQDVINYWWWANSESLDNPAYSLRSLYSFWDLRGGTMFKTSFSVTPPGTPPPPPYNPVIPEPGTWFLLSSGLLGLAAFGRKKRLAVS